jgi:hypothetical protein
MKRHGHMAFEISCDNPLRDPGWQGCGDSAVAAHAQLNAAPQVLPDCCSHNAMVLHTRLLAPLIYVSC